MPTTAEAIQIALGHHRSGRLRDAELIYRQILDVDPANADATQLLGLVAHQAGHHQAAVDLIRRAIELDGRQPSFYSNLGEVYRAMGRLPEAGEAFRAALTLDANFAAAHNNLGNVQRSEGRADEALASYQAAIRLNPAFAEAHNNLGVMLQARGDWDAAMAMHRRAIELQPQFATAHDSLATALKARGRLEEALDECRQAASLDPRSGEIQVNLGSLYQSLGRIDEAIGCYREALRLNPRLALAQVNLGAVLQHMGRHDEAIACYRAALAIQPTFAEASFNLGVALEAQGDASGAIAAYEQALSARPIYDDALVNCGQLLERLGRLDDALALFDGVIARKPDYALAHFSRANIFKIRNMTAEAIAALEVVSRLRPDYPAVYLNMASLWETASRPDEAVECCQKGLRLAPNDSALHGNLAIALHQQGRGEEAIAAYRRAVEFKPDDAAAHSNLLYALNFMPGVDAQDLFSEHLQWAERHAEPLTRVAPPHANDPSPDRRLRVGYVSCYFRHHAVNFFTEPLITSHDHGPFEIYCYSDVQVADDVTRRLKDSADRWRDTAYLSHAELAEQVRRDGIDILVDLTGHIGGSRLLAFARKPAPVQVTYIGYQNTTGMSAMDYRLTDDWADPVGQTDRYHTERLVRLPRAFFCYRPSDDAPAVDPSPAATTGQVTFGSFNNYPKVTPRVIDAWMTILARVPGSRLLVLAGQGRYVEEAWHRVADERGVARDRIELCDKRSRPDYLRLQQRADIALDPFPFNGHTTTCDSVWMGLPVVMLAGQTYPTRFGGSVLRNVGLEHCIARSVDQYIDTAVALSSDVEALAQLRRQLRERMAASPLVDFQGFCRHVEEAYRDIWRQWCRKAGGPE